MMRPYCGIKIFQEHWSPSCRSIGQTDATTRFISEIGIKNNELLVPNSSVALEGELMSQPFPSYGVPPATNAWVPTSVPQNAAPQVFVPPQVR